MKNLIIVILLITFSNSVYSQFAGWNPVTGRSRFMDSMANNKLRNNVAGDSILSTDINGKFKNIKNTAPPPTVFYGVDSTTFDTATHTYCIYSGGISYCSIITGNAPPVTTGIDSIVVTGDQLCSWIGGVSTCYTVSSTINNITNIINYIDSSITINNNPNCLPLLVSGGLFSVGGFTFQNTDLVIEVGCQRYNVPSSIFSIPSAAGADFFVKVYADTSGNMGYIVGPSTPAGIPALTDPGSQVEIATYLVRVGSTTPEGIGTYPIYFEGTEWVFSSNISGADYLYPTNPYAGTYSLFIPATTAVWSKGFEFDGDTISVVDLTYFNFQIRLADTLRSDDAISIGFRRGTSYVSSGVSLKRGLFGLNGDKINEWQPVAISKSLFTFQLGQPYLDGVTFIYGGSLPDIQFDNIQWQVGGANTGGPVVIPPLVDSGSVASDTTTYDYWDTRSGTKLFSLPTFVLHVYYDSCFVVDTVGRNVYISFNQNCGGSGAGGIQSIVAGTNITVDNTDPLNPIVSASGGGGGITALTGDVTASGTGSVAATLATVNSNVGSFTNASITVNGKGLITAASSGTAPLTATIYEEVISTAGQTAFTFATVPTTSTKYNIYRNGVMLKKTWYSVLSNVVTITFPLDLNDSVVIQGIQ